MRRYLTAILPAVLLATLCAVLGMQACIPGSIADQLPYPTQDMPPIPPIDFGNPPPDLTSPAPDGGSDGGRDGM